MLLDAVIRSLCQPHRRDRHEHDDTSEPHRRTVLLEDDSAASHGSHCILHHTINQLLQSNDVSHVLLWSLVRAPAPLSPEQLRSKVTAVDSVSALLGAAEPLPSMPTFAQQHSTQSSSFQALYTTPAHLLADVAALTASFQRLLSAHPSPTLMVVDGLSTLLLYHDAMTVIQLLMTLSTLSNITALVLHLDAPCRSYLLPQSYSALTRFADIRIRHQSLHTVHRLSQPTLVDRIVTLAISHTGSMSRVVERFEQWLWHADTYTLSPHKRTGSSGENESVDAVTATLNTLIAAKDASQPHSTFNLGLTARQRAVKNALTLPFQHTSTGVALTSTGLKVVSHAVDDDELITDDDILDDDEDGVDDDLDI